MRFILFAQSLAISVNQVGVVANGLVSADECRAEALDHRSQITDYRLQITDHIPRHAGGGKVNLRYRESDIFVRRAKWERRSASR